MKQVIDIGSTPGGATLDTLRIGFDKCNDNFTELYGKSPCIIGGSKYIEFEMAIKFFQPNRMESGEMYYVSKIVNGTGTAPNLTYTIEVSKVSAVSGAGTVVMRYTTTGAALTGLKKVALTSYNSSGRFGWIYINWSLLITTENPIGTTFTCANWGEGAICQVTPMPDTASGGGGGAGGDGMQVITTGDEVIDGSKTLYIFNPGAGINVYLAPYADIVGAVKVKNISSYNVGVLPDGDEASKTFDGVTGGFELQAGESAVIEQYDGNFILSQGIAHAI